MRFNIEWHDRLGSTNTFLRERFHQDPEMASGLVIAAREQTDGRGRKERKWESAPNTNLCFSLFLETRVPLVQVPSLTMAVALAVSDMLNARGLRAVPKWPNDVLIHERKICGILSERVETSGARASEFRRCGIIVGIGLNVNMSAEEAAAIDRPATSMLIENGRTYSLPEILDDLLPWLDHWIALWKSGGFEAIRTHWTEKAGPIGKRLIVRDGDMHRQGTLHGFGEHGELLIETGSGIETIWAGDVS